MARIPTIPTVSTGDSALNSFCTAVKEYIELRDGRRGSSASDQFVTRGDLESATSLIGAGLTYSNIMSACTDPIDPPTNFSVTKGHWCNYLSWVNPDDDMFAAIQVWCNTSNDRSGASLLAVVHAPAEAWTHYLEDFTADHYYWIRAVSYNPAIYSTWLPTGPMGGELAPGDETVGETIDKIMDALKGTDPATYDEEVTYYERDLVSHVCEDGAQRRYRCVDDDDGEGITGVAPTDTDHWEQVGILITGEVDGVPTVGVDGNLVVDGTILARHIAADQIDGTHISAASSITLASGGSLTIGNEGSMSIGTGGSISIGEGGSITITGSASGISKFSDANLDNISDGSTWGRVAKTSISAGKIILTSGTGVSGTLPVANTAAKCTDANADQTSANTAADIANLPAATDGAGLYCTGDYLGYYSGSAWMAYIAADGKFLFKGNDNNYVQWNGSSLSIKGSVTITGGSGIANLTDAGALAAKDDVGTGDLQSAVTQRIFSTSTVKSAIEGWRHASDTTKIDGGDIYTHSITANEIKAGTITATEIYATAYINGKRLDAYAQGSCTLSAATSQTITHNFGRYALVTWRSSGNFARLQTWSTSSFTFQHGGSGGDPDETIYYVYM